MNSFQAKYFDGQTPTSILVDLFIDDGVLEISVEGKILASWPKALLFRDQESLTTLIIGNKNFGDSRLEILTPEDQKKIISQLPELGSMPFKFDLKKMYIYLGCCCLFVVLLFQSIKPLTKFAVGFVSLDTEKKILSSWTSFSQVKTCKGNLERDLALERLLAKIYPLSEEDKKIDIHIHIVNQNEENAFALPGGELWLLSGLLQSIESPDELAGIIAHEIEHIKRRHIVESLIRSTLLTSLLSLAAGDVSGVLVVDPQSVVGLLALKFDRDQEAEADEGARVRLKKAGISNSGLIHFFERMKKKTSFVPKFMSTHPADQERIDSLKVELEGKSTTEILDPNEFSKLKTPCE
jgi:Zn-dependent protease with chaperone function